MALSQIAKAAIVVTIPGLLAFIFAVLAENKKPDDPEAAPGLMYDPMTNKSTCHYPSDQSLPLGILSVIFLFITAVLALGSFYYPYNGKRVSPLKLWRSWILLVFTLLAMAIFVAAEVILLWAVIVEGKHRAKNIHSGQIAMCPTAKTGLFGGGGFLALDATLFFLIVLMLTGNARSDYLNGDDTGDETEKGYYEGLPNPAPSNDKVAKPAHAHNGV